MSNKEKLAELLNKFGKLCIEINNGNHELINEMHDIRIEISKLVPEEEKPNKPDRINVLGMLDDIKELLNELKQDSNKKPRYKILPEWFPEKMDSVLVEKDAKKSIKWEKYDLYYFINQIGNYTEELYYCYDDNEIARIERIIIHIANYAMMIGDNLRKGKNHE